ncbi:ATP-dependent nuclease [Paenibacillus barengoltzii]|uniref:ATP-dependent nuclease n=1 Tax=Paenibacillus barengoltzii TaxID=343517 RepID=UPI003F886846
MLIGTFINGYKSYDRAYYIPISEDIEEKYSTYIGNNGVGKSAILESLDVFFNERSWNITRGATREEIYISPVFLINKDKFIERARSRNYYNANELENNEQVISSLEKLNDFYWDHVENHIQGVTKRFEHISSFINTIKRIKESYSREEYLITVIGIKNNGKATFTPFDGAINSKLNEVMEDVDKISNLIKDFYAYVYIPVEQSVDGVLKVEATQMQKLMNKNVLEEIDNALTDKIELNGRNKSFLSFINEHLNNFMKEINNSIQQIDCNYNYGAETFGKKNLTEKDIRDKILEAYFSKRSLKHHNREIIHLSSGEQRKALIDIAYAFLSSNKESDKEIILAIDEPEVSMNIGNCFMQFERLEELANTYGNQVLITTHWYGFLPTTSKGYLYHLSKSEENNLRISIFNFFNYLEERKRFPNDIELKSMFDLAATILSYMKTSTETNWIICEGSDDKIYLESILSNSLKVRILPVGGVGNVVKLYTLLSNPLNNEELSDSKDNKSKIMCLIDTDEKKLNFYGPIPKRNDAIQMFRLQVCEEGQKIKIVNPERQGEPYSRTVMEDCLDPRIYYQALKKVIDSSGDELMSEIFSKYNFDDTALVSKITGDESFLVSSEPKYRKKTELKEFVNDNKNKYKIAQAYAEINNANPIEHQLAIVISDFFNL